MILKEYPYKIFQNGCRTRCKSASILAILTELGGFFWHGGANSHKLDEKKRVEASR
jgi:hypothetical protein